MQEQKAAAQPERGGLPVKTLEGEVVPQLQGADLQVSAAPHHQNATERRKMGRSSLLSGMVSDCRLQATLYGVQNAQLHASLQRAACS